jgi:hypothetical protein
MFRKMPVILISIIIAVLALNSRLPLKLQEILYALSLTLKSGIVLLLPLIIFSLLYKTAVGLARRATVIIALLLLCICSSNFIATFLSHYVGAWVYHFDLSLIIPQETQGLMATWSWQFPKLLANNKAMFLGIILGIVLGILKPNFAQASAANLDWLVSKIL